MPFIFQDFETQSLADLTITGALKYCLDTSTRALLWSWGVDDDPIKLWCPDLSAELVPEVWTCVRSRMAATGDACPAEVVKAFAQPDTYLVGWNEAFDRQVWQQVVTPDHGWPEIRIEQTLDAMCQAAASNLPGKLDMAGRALGLGQKTVGGSAAMKRFADRNQPLPGSPEDIARQMEKGLSREKAIAAAIEMWGIYCDYAIQDTDLMRDVWRVTRPLDADEWRSYWTNEHINDRGLPFDLDVCAGAVQYREEEAEYVEAECSRITDGVIAKPTLTKQINEWVFDRLPDDLAETMVKERDEEGYVTKLTGAKDVMGRLLEDIQVSDAPPSDDVVELLELLQFGRSSSAIKFEKILNQAVDGRLTGSYVFNGAGQTGRFASRGAQMHNAVRDYFKNELDVLDMVAARVPIERLREVGPVSSVLSKLIRPSIVAPEKKLLVWGDWSAIEARVTPWLAGTRDADEAVLEPFRISDADKTKADVYVLNAADVFKQNPDTLWERYMNGDPEAKNFRQGGKVMVLSLAFRGSVGALKAMAKNYNIRLTNEEAKSWVDGWRDRNRWNKRFGVKIEEAAFGAMRSPLTKFKAGRVQYQFIPELLGGTLVCFLPDMRPIVYPMAKISKVEKFGQEVDAITYLNGMGRRGLWDGLQIENCLAGDTRVLTSMGRKRLDEVSSTDLVWDGEEWVSHGGLIAKGIQPTLTVSGVRMTPDHLILTEDGWHEAATCEGLNRRSVRLPDRAPSGVGIGRTRSERAMARTLRVRPGNSSQGERVDPRRFEEPDAQVLRLQDVRTVQQHAQNARYEEAQGVAHLERYASQVHRPECSAMAPVRRAGHIGVRTVAEVREFLGGHGAVISANADYRTQGQQRELRTGELSLGYETRAISQYATQSPDRYAQGPDVDMRGSRTGGDQFGHDEITGEEWLADRVYPGPRREMASLEPVAVYDLLNCGPRNRFVVLDENDEPFIVHNCTQATAASILRGTLDRMEVEYPGAVIGHTHDEVINEVDEAHAFDFADALNEVMVRGFDWTDGLPLAAEIEVNYYYTKNEKAAMKRPA